MTSASSRRAAGGPWNCIWKWRRACPWARRTVGLQPLESELQAIVPSLAKAITHIEPAREPGPAHNADPSEVERIRASLLRFPELVQLGIQAHDLNVRRSGHELAISFHCTLAAATSIKDAHAFTERIEQYLRTQIPNLGRVTVHTEPPGEHS